MVILGAGYIGMSLATVFSKLGSEVTVLEESAFMLNGIDEEIVSLYEKEAKKSKIRYHPECLLQTIEQDPENGVKIVAKAKGQEVVLDAQYVVNAEGRDANIEGLGLEGLGVGRNEKKGISVDTAMRTSVPHVFAAGDVTLEHMWTDVAYMEGVVAAENAMGRKSHMDYSAVPYWTCTVPSVAGVGLTQAEAVKKGYDVKAARFFFAASGMATVLGQRTGMLKLVTERKYGQILGVHIVGAQAAELIAEASLAVKQELTSEDIGAVLHAHPSLSEALWEAARSISGDSIHLPSVG
jgi:dihydrolipoamide dehydrogenase